MNFVGSGKRLSLAEISDAALRLKVPVAALRAVIDVEARGRGFDAKKRPVILFEPHIFHRELGPGSEREKALKLGLARYRWVRSYPKTQDGRYDQLMRGMEINEEAALQSASYGLGQVLGNNWKLCGYGSIFEFIDDAIASEEGQLNAMLGFIQGRKLVDHMRNQNWASFARAYNGPGYKKNAYDSKLRRSFIKYSGGNFVPDPMLDGILSRGEKGDAIADMQRNLVAVGIHSDIDGDFGPMTEMAVIEFQKLSDLRPDGRAGPVTLAALAKELSEVKSKGEPAVSVPKTKPAAKAVETPRPKSETFEPVKPAVKTKAPVSERVRPGKPKPGNQAAVKPAPVKKARKGLIVTILAVLALVGAWFADLVGWKAEPEKPAVTEPETSKDGN